MNTYSLELFLTHFIQHPGWALRHACWLAIHSLTLPAKSKSKKQRKKEKKTKLLRCKKALESAKVVKVFQRGKGQKIDLFY